MYHPHKNVLAGIESAFPAQLFPWDDYFARMVETDWLSGRAEIMAVKSFFIRHAPFGGSYALLGGVAELLRGISDVRFNDEDFKRGMHDMGYRHDFVEWLANQGTLRLQVFSPLEGSVFFPNEPVITIVGPLAHVRFVEGILTEAVNFPTLCLTKWHRLLRTVRPGNVLEFGRRRSQNHKKSTLYGMLAGCFATSNAEMRRFIDVKTIGTMGHEWVQGFGAVRPAFCTWLDHQPDQPVGLVDTKRCLEHDFPIWLDEVFAHREAIQAADPPFWGWRNDSGDLAYLDIEQYIRFRRHRLAQYPWFVEHMGIVLTNELDEYAAESIISQIRTQTGAAGLDPEDILKRIVWAAGTKPATCEDQSSLGGVAKLMEVESFACIKLAFDSEGRAGIKTSIPGYNRSALIEDETGEIRCLLIYPEGRYDITLEGLLRDKKNKGTLSIIQACHPDNPSARMEIPNYRAVPQQRLLYDSLEGTGFAADWDNPTIEEVARRTQQSADRLHWSMTRLNKPHVMKVRLTPDLLGLRQNMISQGVLRADFLK